MHAVYDTPMNIEIQPLSYATGHGLIPGCCKQTYSQGIVNVLLSVSRGHLDNIVEEENFMTTRMSCNRLSNTARLVPYTFNPYSTILQFYNFYENRIIEKGLIFSVIQCNK